MTSKIDNCIDTLYCFPHIGFIQDISLKNFEIPGLQGKLLWIPNQGMDLISLFKGQFQKGPSRFACGA